MKNINEFKSNKIIIKNNLFYFLITIFLIILNNQNLILNFKLYSITNYFLFKIHVSLDYYCYQYEFNKCKR